MFKSRLKTLHFHPSLRWIIDQYRSSLCYCIPQLAIEMLNDGAHKTNSKLILLLYIKFAKQFVVNFS